MSQIVRQISQRMSLRKPLQSAFEVLEKVADLFLNKELSLQHQLEAIQTAYPQVVEFEREFPNLCFAIATGVGKTRLMGAMIAYFAQAKGVRNFIVIAPNNTVLEKLVREFSNPKDSKYVFQGIGEFTNHRPQIITADNFDRDVGVRNEWADQGDLFKGDEVHINIFNIAMIHSQDRRIKKTRETIKNCLSTLIIWPN